MGGILFPPLRTWRGFEMLPSSKRLNMTTQRAKLRLRSLSRGKRLVISQSRSTVISCLSHVFVPRKNSRIGLTRKQIQLRDAASRVAIVTGIVMAGESDLENLVVTGARNLSRNEKQVRTSILPSGGKFLGSKRTGNWMSR